MDSYKEETHRYAFELVKASREMAVDIAEKLPLPNGNKKQLSSRSLKIRINKKI
tara:strand:+ start:169 stop:330 length:162 start_codon:yes stop_codon:yes gene_type:complete